VITPALTSADLLTANLGQDADESLCSAFIDPKGLHGARVGVLKKPLDSSRLPYGTRSLQVAQTPIKVFGDMGAEYAIQVVELDLVNSCAPTPSRASRRESRRSIIPPSAPGTTIHKNAAELLLNHYHTDCARTPRRRLSILRLDHDPQYRRPEGKATCVNR